MQATIQHVGHDIICSARGSACEEIRISGTALLPQLLGWAERYETALHKKDVDEFYSLGRDIFDALNQGPGWAQAWLNGAGTRRLEINVPSADGELSSALLAAPWELLASEKEYLTDDSVQLFEITRRIGVAQNPPAAEHADLQIMFMAAAPEGSHELDFEAEESAILDATARLRLHLVVEESGAADILTERLAADGPFEALHLSCHGNIDATLGPYLAFENETGGMKPAFVGDVVSLLGDANKTPLVFLSACRTAERQQAASAGSFARQMVRAGVHNVLGWDGSVHDADAANFSKAFYRELALFKTVPQAASLARRSLRQLNRSDPQQGAHWHLARLYLGTHGGGALATKGQAKRVLASTARANQFLAAERPAPVAGAAFVGRRRKLQAVLRAFAKDSFGVLVHGMGNLGKSSLAHRVGLRKTSLAQVVVKDAYDAEAIFDRLMTAVPADLRPGVLSTWREQIVRQASTLGDALEHLLQGVFHQRPILLVIDDLEQILEQPGPSNTAATPVKADYRPALLAVLQSFARINTDSRLLITSRYTFSLMDKYGRDMAAALTDVPLLPMSAREQVKQVRAAVSSSQLEHVDQALLSRALKVAGGNPGLQATLTKPLFAEEVEVAEQAIAVIEKFQSTGIVPESLHALQADGLEGNDGNALMDFFKRMAFGTYRAALTTEQARMLTIASFFAHDLPIPTSALEACGQELGVGKAAASIKRLLALGMLDDWGGDGTNRAVSANPMARPLAKSLNADEQAKAAQSAVAVLNHSWRIAKGEVHADQRGVELARLALMTPVCDAVVLDEAATAAAGYFLRDKQNATQALQEVLHPAMAKLSQLHATPSSAFGRVAYDCAERTGDMLMRGQALDCLAQATDGRGLSAGSNSLRLARACSASGELDAALANFENAALQFKTVGAERDVAIARGGIADIFEARGQLDEALRIRTEETLPVYERLGDVRSKAVTMGKIADIFQARGQLDEALRIHTEETLPVYERLGDVRSKAVTMGKSADIFQARGQLDEALRIRTEEEMPAYERLGDVRSKAITMGKIADIFQARGQLDEALRIRTEEEMPVFVKLGDVREKAVTMGKIAGIFQVRGQLEEALAMHEERLPIVVGMGDKPEEAHTKFSIAQIWLQRGDHRQGKAQAIADHLVDAFSISVDSGRVDAVGAIGQLLAQVLAMAGAVDEALKVLAKAQAAFEQLGKSDQVAHCQKLRVRIEGSSGES